MNTYRPRHARHAEQGELPAAMRGLADMIEIIDDTDSN